MNDFEMKVSRFLILAATIGFIVAWAGFFVSICWGP